MGWDFAARMFFKLYWKLLTGDCLSLALEQGVAGREVIFGLVNQQYEFKKI